MKKRPAPLTVFFILIIALLGFGSLPFSARSIASSFKNTFISEIKRNNLSFSAFTLSFDNAVLGGFYTKNFFIDRYGEISILLDKRIIDDVVVANTVYKTDSGQLTWIVPEADFSQGVANLTSLKTVLDTLDIPLLYVNEPTKMAFDDTGLPYGVKDYSQANMAKLLGMLEDNGVMTYDLKAAMVTEGFTMDELFYVTDHHYKTEAGLWAASKITQRISETLGFTIDPNHFDLNHYQSVVYKDWFLGSLGKRVGSTYAKAEDYVMLKPTFETDFTVEIPTTKVTRNGKFEDSLLFQYYLSTKNLYVLNPYMVNLDGDHDLIRINNHNATSDRKILIVKDSFADVMIPFMANEFSEIIVIDLRKLSDIIASEKPDMVIVAYYAALMDSEVTTNFMGE
jgi:hypothetical protein